MTSARTATTTAAIRHDVAAARAAWRRVACDVASLTVSQPRPYRS